MKKAAYGVSMEYSNVLTQLRVAKECGFDALEILADHLVRYLDNDGTCEILMKKVKEYGVEVSCISAIKAIGRFLPEERTALIKESKRLCQAAEDLNCTTIQIMALNELDHLSEVERNDILVENIREIADIGKDHGVKFQIEVVAFTKFKTLAQALHIIERVDRDNVGVVVDFWHLHAGGSTPEEVAQMDVNLIYGVHLCDGRAARPGENWDEKVLRNYQPGEGDVDIPAWVKAVCSTGYNGVWSPEQLSPTHWEDDLWQIGKDTYDSISKYTDRYYQ